MNSVESLVGWRAVEEAVAQGLSTGAAPGVAIGVWSQKQDRAWVQAWGHARKVPSEQLLSAHHFFDLASVSKVIATATLAAHMVDRGWLRWSTPLQSICPDAPALLGAEPITVAHLLSHTAGFTEWAPFWKQLRQRAAAVGRGGLEEIAPLTRKLWLRSQLGTHSPTAPPGARVLYSDLSFLWLGYLLEQLLEMPLDQAVRKHVWDPMGVSGLHYVRTEKRRLARVRKESALYAATEACPWRGEVLQGQVHDDNTWSMGGVAGHAGVFGRVEDVLQFSRALMTGYLSGPVLSAFWSRVAEPRGCERTLGWDTPGSKSSASGTGFSSWTVGHLGFTGTSLWIDVKRGVAVTLLTNRVHPTREGGSLERIRAFRPQVHDAIWRDLAARL